MIDQDELAICRRRGHTTRISDQGWLQCDACGMWVRERRIVEEREDEPPGEELDPSLQSKRHLDAIKAHLREPSRTNSH